MIERSTVLHDTESGVATGSSVAIDSGSPLGEDGAVNVPDSRSPVPGRPNSRGGRARISAARLFSPAQEQFEAVLIHCDVTYLLEALSVGIVILDMHLCPVYANQLGLELLAVTPGEVRGRPIVSLFRDGSALADALGIVLAGGDARCGSPDRLCATVDHSRLTSARPLDLGISPIDGFTTGPHLLLQLAIPQ
jgi:PAS domain-containing protein